MADARSIRERLEESQRRLHHWNPAAGMTRSEVNAMIEKEIFMLEELRRDKPMLRLKVDNLIEEWTDYRNWLQAHNE